MNNTLPRTLLIITIIALSVNLIYAQSSVIKKANKEFDTYDFINAREIYLKVVENGYESAQIFKKLGDTYYFNSDYIDAVKWYKELMEKYPNEMEPVYYHRAAQSLKSIGEYHESKKIMGKYAEKSSTSRIAEIYVDSYPSLDSLVKFQSKKFEVENITKSFKGSDFGPSFFKDKIVYASSSQETEGSAIHNWSGLPYVDLYEADISEDWGITNPEPLKGEINSPYHESTAAFTKDGKTIYFTRNNYINGKRKQNKEKLVTLKIYRAEKNDGGLWTNVKELPFNNDSYSVAHPALSPDETRLYFSSNMAGTLGESDIWYVKIANSETYGTPINLGPEINTEARETFPYVSENNNLYFSSDGHLGLGGLDIFTISLDRKGEFIEVTNLKQPINTNKDDFGFIINEEKQIGYLSSNRDGDEGSISDDIYRVWEKCGIINIEGIVTDAKTKMPLDKSIVTLLNENNKVISQAITDKNGAYIFRDLAECGKPYALRAENDSKEYIPAEKNIITPRGSHTLELNLELTPPDCAVDDLGCRLNLQPIYFDYGKYHIRKDAEVELAKILEALKEYPQLKIHIESHTDSRSSSAFNMRLSSRRAQTTMKWFINKGIDRKRLSAKGYGETQLLNNCSNGIKCPEEDHQLNRRSMFIIKD
ncbi:OmpA family protein [Flagellimonas pacifica]|uniref:WD40-like Beta Propeller Repeat n=1 Tax=Flagellimonas pacifica TaxID=1247520 RepID=A0A285MRI1_9FLAO|nr:OmpA family protein [Allomuricauda parva]SNY99784.1 WD40-like Beta Propeller Repeat [Allomuricauda parva]